MKTKKAEETRARILESALALFREQGYEETTMRAIAEKARVSLGNAYYYFPGKENLIQAFYGRTHDEHLVECRDVLEHERDLGARLKGVLRAKLDTIMPYHRFAGVLFRTAADPESPLNPFSPESRPVREQATALFSEVVSESSVDVPDNLAVELPELLWLYHMGVILFWVHDRSPGCERSYRLAERSSELVVRLITAGSNPLLRPLLRSGLNVLRELKA